MGWVNLLTSHSLTIEKRCSTIQEFKVFDRILALIPMFPECLPLKAHCWTGEMLIASNPNFWWAEARVPVLKSRFLFLNPGFSYLKTCAWAKSPCDSINIEIHMSEAGRVPPRCKLVCISPSNNERYSITGRTLSPNGGISYYTYEKPEIIVIVCYFLKINIKIDIL